MLDQLSVPAPEKGQSEFHPVSPGMTPEASEETQRRQLILTNLKDNVSEADLRTYFNGSPALEEVRFVSPPRGRSYAVLRFAGPALEGWLAQDKSGVFLHRYSEELVRRLTNEKDEVQARQMATRLDNPANLMRLLCDPEGFLEYFHKVLANRSLSFYANTIRVREVWVGNLPRDSNEESVRNALSIFGQVDSIDLFHKEQVFCFARFQLVDQATACVDSSQTLAPKLGSVKVNYSDFLKRYNIVGDRAGVRDMDVRSTSIVFLGADNGAELPKESVIKEQFSNFGNVVNILSRPSTQETHRAYMLIEMATKEQAKNIRTYYALEDKDMSRKSRLGDKRIEINILARPNATGHLRDYMANYLGLSTPPASGAGDASVANHQGGVSQRESLAYLPTAKTGQGPSHLTSDELESKVVWTGFIYKNNKMATGVDAILIDGNAHELFDDSVINLNITNKADFADLEGMKIDGVAWFRPSIDTYQEVYQDLFGYFKEKGVLGWIRQLDRYNLYIAAGVEGLPVSVPPGHSEVLVGVFVKREDVTDWGIDK